VRFPSNRAACHPKGVQGFLETTIAQSWDLLLAGLLALFITIFLTLVSPLSHRPVAWPSEWSVIPSPQKIPSLTPIGSGTHAVAYLVQLGNHLFQSPLSYYTMSGWGMSSGYEK
jgi:hypothetical protein